MEAALEEMHGPIARYRPRRRALQFVYFIQAGADGPIKIGVAHEPAMRLAALQTAHAYELFIRQAIAGGHDLEASLHERFAHLRLLGEWFAPAPELLAYIASLESPEQTA